MAEKDYRILIIEQSTLFSQMLSMKIETHLHHHVTIASNLGEAKKLIEAGSTAFSLALVDLNLPDAPDGRAIDYLLTQDIPIIVFTESYSDATREIILARDVVDYFVKSSSDSLGDIIKCIDRTLKNENTTILVVDDSPTSVFLIRALLEKNKFQVLEAKDGIEACKVIEVNPHINMVITDYNMPKMDGLELVMEVRKKYDRDSLPIISISAHGAGALSARFLKSGANDFLTKPFLDEEFYTRVILNLEIVEQIRALKEASSRDYLTKLYNRRYFFEMGNKLYTNALRGNIDIAAAIMDVDHFKKINDTYGHAAGDAVLTHLARIFEESFRASDIIGRFGGEEFCVLLSGLDSLPTLSDTLERVRKRVESHPVRYRDKTITMTISIGATTKLSDSLDAMINRADEKLYEAKQSGRNRVAIDT